MRGHKSEIELDMMTLTWQPTTAFLGAGGDHPRVDTLDLDSGRARRLMDLPLTHSAYAISVDWDSGTVAVGTKAGLVYISTYNHQGISEPTFTRRLIQGAPILSTLLINNSQVVATDTAGRCLLWNTDQETVLQHLQVTNGVICSLLPVDEHGIVGLSSEGRILIWQHPGGQLVRTIEVPTPPPLGALVNMVFWPAAQALACPSHHGWLTLYDPIGDGIKRLDAHEGPFYAISVCNENLLTAGIADHRLKVWAVDSNKPMHNFQLQENVISMGVSGRSPTKILMVDSRGAVRVYTLEAEKLKPASDPITADYRVIATLPQQRLKAFHTKKTEQEVRKIAAELKNGMDRLSEDVIEEHHSRLIELGYEPVSLALRAEQAGERGNVVEAIRFYRSLKEALSHEDPNVCPVMERYADFLQKAWQIKEADAICKRILDVIPDYPFHVNADSLALIAKAMCNQHMVIEADVPLDLIISSATVIGEKFTGRYVFERGKALHGRIGLSTTLIADKCEQVLGGDGKRRSPRTNIEKLWWISRAGINETELITFTNEGINGLNALQFALQVSHGDLETILIPAFLFDWRDGEGASAVQEANDGAQNALAGLKDKSSVHSRFSQIHRALELALRRLATEHRFTREHN